MFLMRINKVKILNKLPFMVAAVVLGAFSVQALVLNLINPIESATALSITSITSNFGPTTGGNTVTITGDFGVTSLVQASASANNSFALDSNGQIWAWGLNMSGQLGNGTGGDSTQNHNSSIPVKVDMSGVLYGRNIVKIVSTRSPHATPFALDDEGRVFSWGSNSGGVLGNSAQPQWGGDSNVPIEVDMSGVLYGRSIMQIAGGGQFALVLDSEGDLFSWGFNSSGQLGNGTNTSSNIPVEVDMSGVLYGRSIVQIAAGGGHSLALDDEGRIFSWGDNNGGQLGNSLIAPVGSSVPVEVDMTGVLYGRNIIQIAAGSNHSLALDDEGRIFSWGANNGGQLGIGTGGDFTQNHNRNVPVEVDMTGVLYGRNIVQIAGGMTHSLALDDEGRIFSWGAGDRGQLGNGTNTNSNIPVEVDMSGVLYGRDIVQIGTGGHSNFAIDSENNLFMWGWNNTGQLGDGTDGDLDHNRNTPIFVMNLGTPNSITSITLGGLPCTNITIVNPTTITCVAPAHPAGVVDVVVNTLHGSATLPRGYTYIDLPDVPNTGHERI